MMFEKLPKWRAWLEKMGVKVDDPRQFDETGTKMLRNQLLIFSRWCQVMLRFEKGMYEDPRTGSEQAVVGPGREVPAAEASGGPQRARLRQQDPHRVSARSTITTT